MLFSATSEFQGTVNPGPRWSYGYSVAGGAAYALVLFDAHPSNQPAGDASPSWIRSDYVTRGAPAVWRNLSTERHDGVQPGQVSLHAGPRPKGDYAVIRFTAPRASDASISSRRTYKITGRFFAGDSGTTSGHVLKNKDFVNPLRTFDSTSESPAFNILEVLGEGETLDFVVGNNGQFAFGNTPIEVSLECDEELAGAPPADLVPASGQYPVERAQFEVLVLDQPDPGNLTRLDAAGPLDVLGVDDNVATKPVMGALLTWTQSWYTQGLALGQLLHSLALAPGESTRIAMIDWSRRQSSSATESISEGEQLMNDLARSRSIGEVTSAVANEAQEGFSRSVNKVQTSQLGYGLGTAGTGSYENYNFSGGGGASFGFAQGTSDTESRSWTTGRRDVSASLAQQIVDRTHQASGLTRSRWATIVKEVSQHESEQISTRAVTNFNHMHAMTVQYWETVQLYRCVVELSHIDAALFIPMQLLTFDLAVVRRFRREIASAGLNAETRALRTAEPGWIAVSSTRFRNVRNSYWVQSTLDEWAKAIGYKMADGFDTTVLLPQGISSNFDVAWAADGVPVTSIVIHLKDGTRINSPVIDRGEARGPRGLRFGADFKDAFDTAKGGRDIAGISRVSLIKGAGSAMVAEFTLQIASTLADKINMPTMALAANLAVPQEAGEFTAFEFAASVEMSRIINHLNSNRDHYSRAIWARLSSTMVFALLAPYSWGLAGGRPLAGQVDPTPIATAGNYLVFRLHPVSNDAEEQAWRSFLASRDIRLGERIETVVPMPTGGVFAEAVLGRANSAEKIDFTRFWNWQDSPIPITAPEISAIQSGTRTTPEDPKPGTTPAPVLNIMNAPAMPDPTGMAGVLAAIENASVFRDMSGLAATIGAAQAGLGRGFDAGTAAQAQAGENFKTAASLLGSSLTARGSSTSGIEITRSTSNLPATPTNLGGIVELGKDKDRRELSGTIEPSTGGPFSPPSRQSSSQIIESPVKGQNETAMLYGTVPGRQSRIDPQLRIQFQVVDAWGRFADANFECTIKDDSAGDLGVLSGRYRRMPAASTDEGWLAPVGGLKRGILDLRVHMLSESYEELSSDVVDIQVTDVPYDIPASTKFARFTARQETDEVTVTVGNGESLADKISNSGSGTGGGELDLKIVKLTLEGTYGKNWETEVNKTQSTTREYKIKVPKNTLQVRQTSPRLSNA